MIIKKNYRVRLSILFSMFALFYIVIATRLYIIQVHNNDFYRRLAQKQYHFTATQSATRARIYDRNYNVVAMNKHVRSAFALPHQLNKQASNYIQTHFPNAQPGIKEKKKFVWLKRHLSESEALNIESKNYKGIYFLDEVKRIYPYPSLSHVVGLTDIDNKGICGIEYLYNEQLQTKPATYQLQKDARSGNYYFDRFEQDKGTYPDPVVLTIDSTLQYLTQQELRHTVNTFNAKKAASIIMDPETGQILAMSQYPSFDPVSINSSNPIDRNNTLVTDQYELGSIIKIFSAFAALDHGVTTSDELIDCEGKKTYVGNFKVENWTTLGVLPFSDVFRKSSNVGMAKVALRLDDYLFDYFIKFGFGKKAGIDFPGESKGFVNPPMSWSKYSPIVLSFGYEIMGTILQVARAMCMIANDGYAIKPHVTINKQHYKGEKIFKQSSINDIKNMLHNPGTISNSVAQKHPIPGFKIYGKTGTARQVVDGTYSDKHHVYSFAGFIEKDDYRRVIVTFVKEPERSDLWASQISAPLFAHIAEKLVIHDVTHGAYELLDNEQRVRLKPMCHPGLRSRVLSKRHEILNPVPDDIHYPKSLNGISYTS